jgi:hypothetical protein
LMAKFHPFIISFIFSSTKADNLKVMAYIYM